MTLEQVAGIVDNEGFDYAFRHYSDFKEVKDVEFHRLRREYVDAAILLADYIHLED